MSAYKINYSGTSRAKHLLDMAGFPLVFMAILVLSACGGGGGGDAVIGSGGADITYTGSTVQSMVDETNSIELTMGAYQGGPGLKTTAVLSVAQSAAEGEVVTPKPGPVTSIWPVVRQLDSLSFSGNAAPISLSIQTVTDRIFGNCGGNEFFTLNVDDTNGTFTGFLDFNDYCEDGVTGSGRVSLSGSIDLATRDLQQMLMTFNALTMSAAGESVTLAGTVRVDYAPSSQTFTTNARIRDNSSGKVHMLENYILTENTGTGWTELAVLSGRYYHPDFGYVEIALTTPFRMNVGDSGPTTGELTISGAIRTNASLSTLTSNAYEIRADVDGDGSFDWSSGVLNWSAINTAPVANAGPDRVVTTGTAVQLDGSGSSDLDRDALDYSWEFQTRPIASNASLSDPLAVTPTFVPDVDGEYLLALIVNDGTADSAADQVSVTTQKEIVILSFKVLDAEYSKQLNRLIMVSATPASRLYIFDPLTGSDTPVDLPQAPSSVSVGPDGLHAAVGHNGWISYVNLSTATVEKTFAVSTDVLDVVLGGNGYVYAFPRQNQWETIRSVNIVTEVETLNTGGQVYAGTLARLHPDETAIYGADNGLSPSDIEKYAITSGTAAYLYDSPYHGDYPMCGELWFSEDGARVFTRCGNIFNSSGVQATDMTYNGSLSNTTWVESLSHSMLANKLLVIPAVTGWPLNGTEDTELHVYAYSFLTFETAVTLPSFSVGGQAYVAHGKYVFYAASGNNYFVIVQADASSGLLNDFGVVAY